MSGERADVIESATEVIFAARLERDRIQFPGHALLAESQHRVLIRIDADIDRCLKRNSSLHSISFETCAEGAKDRAARFFFGGEFRASHEAIRESHAAALKAQGANHAIAIEPITIAETAAREPRRAVKVVSSANEVRDLAFDILDDVRALARFKREGAFEQRCAVVHPAATSTKDSAMSSNGS